MLNLTVTCSTWEVNHLPVRAIANVLQVARRWEMERPYRWALLNLGASRYRSVHTPVTILQLAFKHSIKPFVEQAVYEILEQGLTHLTSKEMGGLDGSVLNLLYSAAFDITKLYSSAAHSAPPIPDAPEEGPIHNHDACRARWREFWAHVVAPKLLHPTNPLKLRDLPEFLRNEPFTTVPELCRKIAIPEVEKHPVLLKEDRISRKAARLIENLIPTHVFDKLDKELIKY